MMRRQIVSTGKSVRQIRLKAARSAASRNAEEPGALRHALGRHQPDHPRQHQQEPPADIVKPAVEQRVGCVDWNAPQLRGHVNLFSLRRP